MGTVGRRQPLPSQSSKGTSGVSCFPLVFPFSPTHTSPERSWGEVLGRAALGCWAPGQPS